MSVYKIQGKTEKRKGIYYEFDSEDIPLGEGGMGKVYRGRCVDEKTGASRQVAVKFLYSDLPAYAIEKARREAAIQFRHNNLIEMLGFVETESEGYLGETQHHYHVVSELLEGVALDKMFEGRLVDQRGHVVPYAEKLYKDYQQDPNHFAIEVVKNLLSGLVMMHDAGYIHRDIDPTNIMITTDGHIKLIDFGIAKKYTALTNNDKHLTQAGQFVGKPEYASPELVLGAIDEQNPTTDLYAVGILLFQCIVGHVPFQGDRADILQKQLHSPLPLKLIKNHDLRSIIARATEKSRAKRFQSASEFRVALEQVDLTANHPNWWRPAYTYALSGIAAGVALVGGVTFAVQHWPKPEPKQTNTAGLLEVTTNDMAKDTFALAVAALHSQKTSSEGLQQLERLSNNGNPEASFLLSRLYFQSKYAGDYCPDSIRQFQRQLNLHANNGRAHELLKRAVEQDPRNYHALYELACDYWGTTDRTDAVPQREGKKAFDCYSKALTYAEEAHDNDYIERINKYLKDCMQWNAQWGN